MKRLFPYWPDVAALLLFIILPLIVFAPQTLGGRSLIPTENLYQYEPYATYREVVGAPAVPHNHLVSDLVLENYQWKHFLREQISLREIPLWNPQQFSGIPFMAAGQHSGLYPVSLLYYVLPLQSAYGWYTVVNLALAGMLMYAYLRGLGAGRAGAAIAGVIYQLCGFVLASVVFQMMIGAFVWLPLLLLMSEWIMRRRGVPFVAILVGAAALGLNILAGHVEITLYTLLIVGYVSAGRLLWLWWHTRDTRFVISRGVWLGAMIVLGFGVGALQFVPLLEFVQTSWRTQRSSLSEVLGYAHPMRDALQFLMPNLYGSPAQHSLFDVFTNQTFQAPFVNGQGRSVNFVDWGMKNYVESALYVGILPLLLTAYALTRLGPIAPADPIVEKTPPYRLIYGSLAILGLTFMFGLPTYALMYLLPGINQLNSPFRWIYAVTLCICVFAAFGMDALTSGGAYAPDDENETKLKRENQTHSGRRWGMAILAASILLMIGLIGSRLAYPAIESLVERVFGSMALADQAFPNGRLFYSHILVQAAIFAGMLFASGVVWILIVTLRYREKGMARHAPTIAAIVLVAFDLIVATGGFNPASNPELLNFVPPVVQYLQGQQAQGERFRFTTLEDPNHTPILPANVGWMYGLEDIRGYDSIIGRDYVAYMRALAPQGQLQYNRIAPLFVNDFDAASNEEASGPLIPDRPLLDLLNVRYIVTYKYTNLEFENPDQAWTLVYEDEAVRLWENPNAVPRAFLLPPETSLPQKAEDGTWDYAALRVPEDYTPLTVGTDTGREKFVDVPQADEGSWLIISETWANGWRAFIRPLGAGEDQEKPYDVVQVYGTLQGVKLSEGAWTVRLVYSPTSFQVGLFGSLISVAIGAFLIGLAWWRRMVGSGDQASTAGRIARNSVAPIVINIFNRGIDFAFLLVMLRILSPTDVGTYYYLVIIFGWFDIFTNFGLDLFLIREIARDKAHAGRYFYQSSLLRGGLTVLGVPLLLGYIAIRQATVEPALTETALITLGLLYAGLFPASLSKGMSALFYAHEQAETPAAIATITTINKAIFGVMVLLLGGGIIGLAGVSILNNFITLIILVATGRKFIGRIDSWAIDTTFLRTLIHESYPLLLNHFLATIFFQIDVIILEATWGATTVAHYSVAYRWILTIMIIPSYFTQALLPVMSRQHQENPEALRKTYAFGIKLMFALAVPAAAFFTFFAVPLVMLMGDAQYLPDGAIALQLMIWSIPIGWLNSLTQYALIAVDLQRRITWAFVVAVSFNIISNVILIPRFGYPAAAVTTILSELALLIPFALLMQQGLHQRLNWGGLLWRQALAGSVMLILTLVLTPMLSYLALVIGLGVYAVVLLVLRPLDEPERDLARRFLPKPLARLLG